MRLEEHVIYEDFIIKTYKAENSISQIQSEPFRDLMSCITVFDRP